MLRDPGALQGAAWAPADIEVIVSCACDARLSVKLSLDDERLAGTAVTSCGVLWATHSIALWEDGDEDG